MICRIHPTTKDRGLFAPKIIVKIKSFSTNQLWKMYGPQLNTQFWVEHTFWSDGYFVCSTGDASTETIKKYIESRG